MSSGRSISLRLMLQLDKIAARLLRRVRYSTWIKLNLLYVRRVQIVSSRHDTSAPSHPLKVVPCGASRSE